MNVPKWLSPGVSCFKDSSLAMALFSWLLKLLCCKFHFLEPILFCDHFNLNLAPYCCPSSWKTIAIFSTNRTTIKLRFSFRNQHIVCQLTLQALLLKFNLRILFFCLVFILEASSQDTGTVQIFLTSDHWSSVLKLVTVLWNGLRCFEIEFLDQETQDNEDMENYYYLHCAAALLPGNPILPLLSNHGPNCIQFIPWVEKRIKHHQLESS